MGDKMEEDTPGPETRVPAPQKTPTVDEPLEVSDVLKQQFHGATVRQLNLLPPATAKSDTPVSTALPMARAHGGQCILVVDEEKLRGFVEMVDLVIAETEERLDVPLGELQRPFAGTKEAPAKPETYRVITPETELAELSVFFETHAFALVTDAERMSVQSVATPADLARYVEAAPVPSSLDARAAEEARKDRSLADMLRMLEQFSPLIPDEVTDFYLERAGFQSNDVRLYVFYCLHAASVCSHWLRKSSSRTSRRTRSNTRGFGPTLAPAERGRALDGYVEMFNLQDRTRTVLTMDDLSAALGEYGIDARRADGFR